MSILIFFLKIVFCSGVLFFYYQFFLRNKKFHHYNRFYLLSTAIISLIFPFINISFIFAGTLEEKPVLLQAIETISVNQWELKSEPLNGGIPVSTWLFNLQNGLLFIYLAGFVFVAILLLRSLQYINHIRKSYAVEKLGDLHIYDTVEPGTPFSFFKSIFWNRQIGISSKEGQQIFRHELFHVRQQHSADSLFMEIVGCIAWFNPFFYIIRKELKAIHEFLADQYAISSSDRYAYAALLIRETIRNKNNSITNPFFHTQIKRRITMITKFNNKKYSYWSRVMVLPVAVFLFCSFAITIKPKPVTESENPYDSVQRSLITTIHYPQKALSENKQGEILAVFVIADNGNISNITLLTTDNYEMGDEVTRALKKIPASKLADLKKNRSGAHILKTTFLLEPNDHKIPYNNAARFSENNSPQKIIIDFEIVVTALTKGTTLAESKDMNFIRSLKITDTVDVSEKSATLLLYLKNNPGKRRLLSVNRNQSNEKIFLLTLDDHKAYRMNEKTLSLLEPPQSIKDTTRLSPEAFEKLFNQWQNERITFETSVAYNNVYLYKKNGKEIYYISKEEFDALQQKNHPNSHGDDKNVIFSKVEIEPVFPGGDAAWQRFLHENLSYPKAAIDKEISGNVIVQFIVNKDGSLHDIQAITGPEELKQEAIRLIRESKKWIPALQNRRIVTAYYKKAITFAFEKSS